MLFRPHIFYKNRYEHNVRINSILKIRREQLSYYNDDDLEIEVDMLVYNICIICIAGQYR